MARDLELISTNELVKEVFHRYEHVVFAGLKFITKDSTDHECHKRWKGNGYMCAGLAIALQTELVNKMDDQLEEIDEDEWS